MNGYLFCFQEVLFSIYHGISDWNGLSRFIKTIICRYAPTLRDLQANLNPYEFYAKQDAIPLIQARNIR